MVNFMGWAQSGNYYSVSEYLTSVTGLSENEILNPPVVNEHEIENMQLLRKRIEAAIVENTAVAIVGDYDADGVTSTAILTTLFQSVGLKVSVRIPKRFTEGYGISPSIVDSIEENLIVTVDNGIAAFDAVARAVESGKEVLILDHHLPDKEKPLPNASIIVDPHVNPDKNAFQDYCGAGLAYKLATFLLNSEIGQSALQQTGRNATYLLDFFCGLACIGTVGDVMPLIHDNRRIVQRGLQILNARKPLTHGLKALLNLDNKVIDEEFIKFTLAPMLNAPSRLYNAGAMSSLKTLLCTDKVTALKYAGKMKELNKKRQDLTKEGLKKTEALIEEYSLNEKTPICVCVPDVPEGIVGIIAGRISKQYQKPTFILTNIEDGVLKGSGRSYSDFSIEHAFSLAKPYLLSGGGHAGAAGLSLKDDAYSDVVNALQRGCVDFQNTDSDTILYDIVVDETNAESIMNELKKFAPFGEGIPRPVFYLQNFKIENARFIGQDNKHLKFTGKSMDVLAFGFGEQFKNESFNECMQFIGSLEENHYAGNVTLQLKAIDVLNCMI